MKSEHEKMARITLDLRKSLEENASVFFEKAKKAKKKLEGARKALEASMKKLQEIEEIGVKLEKHEKKEQRKKEWYEKFRWFISSDDFLVVGGRDATSNEIIIKKNTDKNDLVFHTEAPGSPFVVIKNKHADSEKIPEQTLKEAAELCASYSRAWRYGTGTAEVYCIKPEQVSKKAEAGEFIGKGAFMIYGKRRYFSPALNIAIGKYEDKIMGGPVSAIKKNCKEYVEIIQGDRKISDVAKIIQKRIGGELDEIIRNLPQGCNVKK